MRTASVLALRRTVALPRGPQLATRWSMCRGLSAGSGSRPGSLAELAAEVERGSPGSGPVRPLRVPTEQPLAAASGSVSPRSPSVPGHQVLIHDHRDLKFLKTVTAGGLFATLMSSSAAAYAFAFALSPLQCGGLIFQTVAAGACTVLYLRTYVARAVLEPRRGQLSVIGCSFFGEPMTTEQVLPLALLQPGSDVTQDYISFRIKGSVFNPACWIPYRMPRSAGDDPTSKPGVQVGGPLLASRAPPAKDGDAPSSHGVVDSALSFVKGGGETLKPLPRASSASSTSVSPARRFRGAGLGSEIGDFEDGPVRRPSAPARRSVASPLSTLEAAPAARSLVDLRLKKGLPVGAQEEQKILDFFDNPTAYAANSFGA